MRLLYALPLLLAPAAVAQTYVAATAAGGPSADIGEAIATGPDGAVYVAGTFDGTADFGDGVTATSAGDSDAFLVKYDPDGVALWARRAGTDVFNDFGEGVAADESGAVYLAGTFTGIATFDGGTRPDTSITTRNDFDAFLARYTADGDLDWVRRVGGPAQDVGHAVAVTPDYELDGPVALIGSFTGSAEAGDTTLVSAGGTDAFAAVFSPEGDLLWARSAGGSGSDAAYDGAFSSRADSAEEPFGGDLYLAGQFSGVAVFDPGVAVQSAGLGDAFVARYDASGAAQWASRVGGAESDYARGLVLAGQGQTGTPESGTPYVYLGGSFSEDILVGGDVLQSAGFTDAFLAAFDAEGDALWGRRGGGEGFDFAEDVTTFQPYVIPTRAPNTSTPVFLVGYFDGDADFSTADTTATLTSAGGQDGFFAAYTAGSFFDNGDGGDLIAAYAVGGSDRDAINGVSAYYPFFDGRDFNPVLTGSFRGTVDFPGAGSLSSGGGLDLFVAELAACPDFFCLPVGTEQGAATAPLALSAAPNPFVRAATVTLALPVPGEERVAAPDVLGREVAVLHDGPAAPGTPFALERGALAPGTYVARAEAGGAGATAVFTVTD